MANVTIERGDDGKIVVHLDGVEVKGLAGPPRVEFAGLSRPIVTLAVEAEVLTVMLDAGAKSTTTATVPGMYEIGGC